MLELGYAFLSSLSLPEVAEPHLERLVAEVHESSSVSVLDGDDIVYVARVPDLADHARVDQRRHALPGLRDLDGARAAGRAGPPTSSTRTSSARELRRLSPRTITSERQLRAELDRVRAQGWAMVDQELEEGLRSVAAPIRDRGGRVVAAVNLSAHASRTSTEAMQPRRCCRRCWRRRRGSRPTCTSPPRARRGGRRVTRARGRRPAAGPRPAAGERAGAAIVAAVVLLAINLRSVLAGLPPLVADVRADLGLSAAAAGRADHAAGAVHGRVRAARAAARRARADRAGAGRAARC